MASKFVFLLTAAAIQAGCASPTPATDARAEEAAIRMLDIQWSAAATKKDLDAILRFYSTSGATMWPEAPTSHGAAAIRAAWVDMFKTPGVSLQFLPDRIEIANSADMATDEGRVVLGMDTRTGRNVDTVKYLVVWKKEGGAWKVTYDTYSSNGPALPAPPVKKD